MPRSMTGFARIEKQETWGSIACEIRSVNHRYLEPSIRLPENLKGIENAFRNLLKAKLSRGKVEAFVYVKLESGEQSKLALNAEFAGHIQQLASQISSEIPNAAPINVLEILKWPGVLQAAEIDKTTIEESALTVFEQALDTLVSNREREGEELKTFIEQRLIDITESLKQVRARLPEILEAHQIKLREKLDILAIEINEDRLAQELVFIAQKADVAEELDRLDAHMTEVNLTLKQQKPIGRRLDFLMQELNREANTLSSKSIASDTTQHAVDLKVFIEQMREQIQNLE